MRTVAPAEVVDPATSTSLSYQSLQRVAAATDLILFFCSGVVGFFTYKFYMTGNPALIAASYSIGAATGILFVILGHSYGLYQISVVLNPLRYIKYFCFTIGLAILLVVIMIVLLEGGADYSRGSMLCFGVLAVGFVVLGRMALAGVSTLGVQNSLILGKRVVTIGVASELERLAPVGLRQFGFEELARVGLVDCDDGNGLGESGRAAVARAIGLARKLSVAEFVLMIPWGREKVITEINSALRAWPLSVTLVPDSAIRGVLGRQSSSAIDSNLALEVQREPLNRTERMLKRSIDLILAIVALVLLAPIFLMAALAVKLESKGPVLFCQRRVGFDNKNFVIFKFRTMTVAEDGGDVVQARPGDKRVTRVGRLLRRSSIDELPQLFNVIRGDMSLVGPRPHAVAHHYQYEAAISSYALRHHVKPGLTGMAQIRGFRGETRELVQMERRVEQDLWYINHWSIWLDLSIMARTCLALLQHEAY